MPNTTKPLTPTEVEQSAPRSSEYKLGDGGGLYLAVKPNGKKFWLFNYQRPISKRRNNISFGRYPDFSLVMARQLRERAKDLLADNIDPQKPDGDKEVSILENFIARGYLGKYSFGYLRFSQKPNVWGVRTITGRFIEARQQSEGGAKAEARLLRGKDV